jgi:transposase
MGVCHPKSSAWIAKDPLKRDRLDALKLAELLRMDLVHEVYFSDDDHRTLFKQIVQHYDDITQQEVRLKLKIKARLRAQGVIARGLDVYTSVGRGEPLGKVRYGAAREAIEQLYSLLDHSLKARGEAKRLMRQESRRYPEIALLEGAPGVGLIGACRFSAYIQTPFRFSTKRKLWRYCKLGITDRRSDGKSIGRQALDWNGNGKLKEMSRSVFLGALKSKGENAFKTSYRKALETTHDKDHARLSTQRKILTVMWTLWKRGEEYKDEKALG